MNFRRRTRSGASVPASRVWLVIVSALSSALLLHADEKGTAGVYRLPLSSTERLILQRVEARASVYLGKQAVRVIEGPTTPEGGQALALLPDPRFQDGTIDVDVAGRPRPGSFEGARGFVGIALLRT